MLVRHLICKCSAGPVAACAALATGVPPAAGHGPGREDFNKGISQRRMTRTCDEAFPKCVKYSFLALTLFPHSGIPLVDL